MSFYICLHLTLFPRAGNGRAQMSSSETRERGSHVPTTFIDVTDTFTSFLAPKRNFHTV